MTENWRQITRNEYPLIRPIMQEVLADEAYLTLPADAAEEDCITYWFGSGDPRAEVWLLEDSSGRILGSFYQRPNQYALGAHVANGGYIVAADARGRGVGRKLGEKSLQIAKERGYRAIQFNFVVSNNESAVRLWKSLGFAVIATIPGGFHYKGREYVDAYIMYREL